MGEKKQDSGAWFGEFQKLNKKPHPSPSPPPPTPPRDLPPRKTPSTGPAAASRGKEQRRAYPRFDVDEVRVTLYKEGLLTKIGIGKANKGRFALNLSEGGVRMTVSERVIPGTKVRVRIEIEKYQDAIEAAGEVRWCYQNAQKPAEFFAGVMFLDLDDASRRKIQMMREWFTSPQYKAVRDTKQRQRRTPGDIRFER